MEKERVGKKNGTSSKTVRNLKITEDLSLTQDSGDQNLATTIEGDHLEPHRESMIEVDRLEEQVRTDLSQKTGIMLPWQKECQR